MGRGATRAGGLRSRGPIGTSVNSVEHALRRLALNDEGSVRTLLSEASWQASALDAKGRALVRLGALLSVGAATVTLRCNVEVAHAVGASEEEILGVLLSIGPAIGEARTVEAAPRLALALGYDVEGD